MVSVRLGFCERVCCAATGARNTMDAASIASTARQDPDERLIMGKDCSVATRITAPATCHGHLRRWPPAAATTTRRHDETLWLVEPDDGAAGSSA